MLALNLTADDSLVFRNAEAGQVAFAPDPRAAARDPKHPPCQPSGFRAACLAAIVFLLVPVRTWAQGGPPYLTNDPGTPGNNNWEINLGYEPFLYNGFSSSHVPDVDINYGVGDRIQLTYENAWLRATIGSNPAKYGLGQDDAGVKWRFYDNGEKGLSISIFPQVFLNNPDAAAQRGITPPQSSLLLPMEFKKKLGPVDVDYELGYTLVHHGRNGWISGLVVGHDVTKKLELDAEFYGLGTYRGSGNQDTIGGGARYKLHPPFIILLMLERSIVPARNDQPSFVGYFGMQFLLPPKPFQ